jgi:UrcA family protein
MRASILSNIRTTRLLATFALGTIPLISTRAQADDPEQVDQVTVSAPSVRTVGRDSATGAPIEKTTKTVSIKFDPVTLTTNSGVSLLRDSVSEAAHKVCASMDPIDPEDETCVRNALESANPQVEAAIARARSTAK